MHEACKMIFNHAEGTKKELQIGDDIPFCHRLYFLCKIFQFLDFAVDFKVNDIGRSLRHNGLGGQDGKDYFLCVRMLIEAGADINHTDKKGNSALSVAPKIGNTKAIDILK